MVSVEFIELDGNRTYPAYPNKAVMMQCAFRRCKFYNMVIGMARESVHELRQKAGGTLQMLGQ